MQKFFCKLSKDGHCEILFLPIRLNMNDNLKFLVSMFVIYFIGMQSINSFVLKSSKAQVNRSVNFATLKAKQKGSSAGKGSKKSNTAFVSIEDADNDLWKLEPLIDILRKGDA